MAEKWPSGSEVDYLNSLKGEKVEPRIPGIGKDGAQGIKGDKGVNGKDGLYLEAVIRDTYRKDDKDRLADLSKVNKELQMLQTRLSNAQTMMLDGAFDAAEYKAIKAKLEPEVARLRFQQADLNVGNKDEQELTEFGFHFLRNFAKCFPSADLNEKRRILGSTFPERMIFENGKCRTLKKKIFSC